MYQFNMNSNLRIVETETQFGPLSFRYWEVLLKLGVEANLSSIQGFYQTVQESWI